MAFFFSVLSLLTSSTFAAEVGGLNFPFSYGNEPQPFSISVDPAFINQTLQKVALYRPSRAVQDYPEWNDGPPPEDVNNLAHYWTANYDWFSVQKEINNNFSHYTTSVPGSRNYSHTIPLHFIHERSSRDDAMPLLLLHGWPSTHLEWTQVVQPLAHPSNSSCAFHVVAPDLPGFGFSPAPEFAGQGPREVGDAVDKLMKQLGYTSYGLVTTDLGWYVGNWMVYDQSDSIRGHISDFAVVPPNATDATRFASNQTTPEETRYINSLQAYSDMNAGYADIQRTRPMSLALAMTDSPVGFTGWVWQLLHFASDGFEYSFDEIITSSMMLWIQGTFGNMRTYKEYQQVCMIIFPVVYCILKFNRLTCHFVSIQPEYEAYPKTKIPTGYTEWGGTRGPYLDLANFAFVVGVAHPNDNSQAHQ